MDTEIENCDHKYIPHHSNIWESPYCEKCGKLMPYEEQD